MRLFYGTKIFHDVSTVFTLEDQKLVRFILEVRLDLLSQTLIPHYPVHRICYSSVALSRAFDSKVWPPRAITLNGAREHVSK